MGVVSLDLSIARPSTFGENDTISRARWSTLLSASDSCRSDMGGQQLALTFIYPHRVTVDAHWFANLSTCRAATRLFAPSRRKNTTKTTNRFLVSRTQPKKSPRFSTGNRIDTVLLQYRTSDVEQWPIQ